MDETKQDDNLNKKIKSIHNPNSQNLSKDDLITDMIATGTATPIDLNTLNAFTQVSRGRDQIYTVIDQMVEDPVISAVLETYAEDATEYNEQGKIV